MPILYGAEHKAGPRLCFLLTAQCARAKGRGRISTRYKILKKTEKLRPKYDRLMVCQSRLISGSVWKRRAETVLDKAQKVRIPVVMEALSNAV